MSNKKNLIDSFFEKDEVITTPVAKSTIKSNPQKYSKHKIYENPESNQEYAPFTSEKLCNLDTSQIVNWAYHDRPESELGDIDSLANDLIKIGQQQPCIVRPHPSQQNYFELIIGERRWRAAQKAGVKLKVIVRHLDDNEAALAQAAENDNRTDLSDYAKGMHFARLIEKGIIKQRDLTEKLGKSRQYVSSILSFSKLPTEIINAIGLTNMKNVSASMAERIKQLCDKGDEYLHLIKEHAEKIASGKIGRAKLEACISNNIIKRTKKDSGSSDLLNGKVIKIITKSGRHVGSLRNDNNYLPSWHYPKSIVSSLGVDKIIEISREIGEMVEEKLNDLKVSVATDKKQKGNDND